MAFSTAVRFGREGKWASGLGDDPERLADVEGDGRDPRWCLRPRRLGRADEPDVTALASELMGFHRKGQAEYREGRSFPLPPPARRPHRAGPANRVPYPLQQPSGLMAKRAPPCALQPEGRPPLPCVTVTLHPFFSGQTEKPGELRADGHPPQNGNTQTFRANRAFPCPLQHRGRNGWTKKRGRSPLPP